MTSQSFDDPALQAAMRAFLDARAAVDAAPDDVAVLLHSEAAAVSGMQLRKRLVDLGWVAPSTQRTST